MVTFNALADIRTVQIYFFSMKIGFLVPQLEQKRSFTNNRVPHFSHLVETFNPQLEQYASVLDPIAMPKKINPMSAPHFGHGSLDHISYILILDGIFRYKNLLDCCDAAVQPTYKDGR